MNIRVYPRIFKTLKILLVLGISVAACCILQEVTQRDEYLYIRGVELRLREKIFIKGNSTVKLSGMIHVAEKEFYEKIIGREVSKKKGVVTLMEGVGKSHPEEQTYLDYVELAKLAGLESQISFINRFPNIVRADKSFDDLSPELKTHVATIEMFLDLLIKLTRKEITYEQAKIVVDKHREKFQALTAYMSDLNHESNEMVKGRNEVLWAAIQLHAPFSREVIVPWGAAHLQDIEARLLSSGYTLKESNSFKAINLAGAVTGNLQMIKALYQIESLIAHP